MELAFMAEFVAVAECHSFEQAAQTLHMRQSALQRHILKMEDELGMSLVVRSNHKAFLTPSGATLLPYARRAAALYKACTTAVQQQIELTQNCVLIGSMPNWSAFGLSDLLTDFQKGETTSNINVQTAPWGELIPMLRRGDFNIVMLGEPAGTQEKEFARIHLRTDRLQLAVPSSHRMANSRSVDLKALEQENFLLPDQNSLVYLCCIKACKEAGFVPFSAFDALTGTEIKDFLKKGMGVALLLDVNRKEYMQPGISVVPLEPPLEVSMDILYVPERLSPMEAHFVKMCRERIEKMQTGDSPEF